MSALPNQLDRVDLAGASGAFDFTLIAGAGLIGSQAAYAAAPCSQKLLIVDCDKVSETTTILPPYFPGDIGDWKANVLADGIKKHFRHLETASAVMDVRRLGSGFWNAISRFDKAAILVFLDNPASAGYVVRAALSSGLPAAAASVGTGAVEVLMFPADTDTACYGCLGLTDESRPCLGTQLDSAPTISTPAFGAIAAGAAVELARLLVNGEITQTLDVRLSPTPDGLRAVTAEIQRDKSCRFHAGRSFTNRVVSSMTTDHTWSEITEELSEPEAMLITGTLPPVANGTPEALAPLYELGVPRWPVLQCELPGGQLQIELLGDAGRLGLSEILEVKLDD